MAAARINLVRVQTLAASEGLSAVGQPYLQHDEVELLRPDGTPAVIIDGREPRYIPDDVLYDYGSGSIGMAKRRMRHALVLGVTDLGDGIRTKLGRWLHDRALVRFCPGFGRYTEIAYRPLPGAGGTLRSGATFRDLTGKYTLGTTSSNNVWWDPWDRVLRGPFSGTNPRRVVPTPAGASQIFERVKYNRFSPVFPASANQGFGAGNSGWTKVGTNSADLSFFWSENGFGHTAYPHALLVTADSAANRERAITAYPQWEDPTGHYLFTGTRAATVSIWLRGAVSEGALLRFTHGSAANKDEIELDGLSMEEWTKYSLRLSPYQNDWQVATPDLSIILTTGAAAGQPVSLFVGPCIVHSQLSNESSQAPELCLADVPSADRVSAATFAYPAAGSLLISCWWPEGLTLLRGTYLIYGETSEIGSLYVSGNTLTFVQASGITTTATIAPTKNAINTFAVVWGVDQYLKIYHNGALVATSTNYTNTIAGQTGVRLGAFTAPLLPLTWRIDRRAYSAQQIAELDTVLRDPVCNGLAVQARGRQYRVIGIPSVPGVSGGQSVWSGEVVLEEHHYDPDYTDITSEEA